MPAEDTLIRFGPRAQDPAGLTISISNAPPTVDPALEAAIEARWAELLVEKPESFDGPILTYRGYHRDTHTVHACVDSYRRLGVQSAERNPVQTGVTILSVTGVLVVGDGVIVAKRSDLTRVYPEQWELAPSGGIPPPPPRVPSGHGAERAGFGGELALAALRQEAGEELGVDLDTAGARILGLVADPPPGHSMDLVIRVEIEPVPVFALAAHEYLDVGTVAVRDLCEFVRAEPCIPPLVALAESGLLL
ncbi:MAG: hypothetical protein ACF8Q5_08255 [Phycisphaerales bacterium JB040]